MGRLVHSLHVHLLVDVLQQLEPHDAVVRAAILRDGAFALLRRSAVKVVDVLRIEDLVDTENC